MNEKVERVKAHLRKNKREYIAGGVGVVVGATVALIIIRRGDLIKVTSSQACTVINKAKNVTVITTFQENRGRPGFLVRCLENGKTYPSQKRAGSLLGIDPSKISRQINGSMEHADGFHFMRVPE